MRSGARAPRQVTGNIVHGIFPLELSIALSKSAPSYVGISMGLEEFGKRVAAAISELRLMAPTEILLVHHDDADGLCSAAVIKAALEREGYGIKTLCLEKAYPEVIESLHKGEGAVIFYGDIGSAHADLISECNRGRNLTIILDHHDSRPAVDPRIYDLNLENYGFRGETEFSGTTCCYLFAKALNPRNADLSYLALVGSCEIPNGFASLNRTVLDEAIEKGVVHAVGNKIMIGKFRIKIEEIFSKLQILGSVGYYKNGPKLGIQVCLEGITEEVKGRIDEWEALRREANKRLLGRLYRERLKETGHLQWFDAGDAYTGMGSKVIGTFCSFLVFQKRLVKPNKYILGFTQMSPEVPGYGRLKENYVKASVRIPEEMKKIIDAGKAPPAMELLVEASKGFGTADGHAYAASCILPVHMKQKLIENAENLAREI
jgi:single-stranded-DNA-specific exonuclease